MDSRAGSNPSSVAVRVAPVGSTPAVLSVLDAAMLETDPERVRASVERGETLVAVPAGEIQRGQWTGERVLGALVRDGERICSVAVRRRRRGQTIGTALVERAASDADRLVAEFDRRVRPFYESLGFDVVSLGDGRYRGEWPGDAQ